MKSTIILTALLLAPLFAAQADAQYPGWQQTGSIFILTTPEGADLPATAAVKNFPLLVKLHKGARATRAERRRPTRTDTRSGSRGDAAGCSSSESVG